MKNIVRIFIFIALCGNLLAQSALQVSCPASPVQFCDVTPNQVNLWNETYWNDLPNGTHDLSEAPTDIHIDINDTCAITNVRYLLFLDLDGNDTVETVIDSDNLPGFNNVQFGNAFNVNYTGGTASAFDERILNPNEKYGFALQTTTNGNITTAALRWNTQQAPGTYTIPELPYGTHRIEWTVTDACGNESTCAYTFTVKDCKAPTVVCLNGRSVNIMPTGVINLWAVDFLQYAEDNSTRSPNLKYAIRKSGTGTGFPVDSAGNPVIFVSFDCNELGINPVEVWTIDLAGNADYCETYLLVADNMGNCPGGQHLVTTCVNFWKDGSPINMGMTFQGPGSPGVINSSYDSLGCLLTNLNIPVGSNFTSTPSLDTDPLNGVNTVDLIRMARHILGLEPLPAPYGMIAADVNKSGSITTFDILELRKLLLGVYNAMPNNTSWRFVDANYQFPNQNNPFQATFSENVSIANFNGSDPHIGFIGIKVGDVNGTAYPGLVAPEEDRSTTLVTLPDVILTAGESMDLPLRFVEKETSMGLQMALKYDPNRLQIETVQAENLPGWDENSWAQPQSGQLRLTWFDTDAHTFQPDENVVMLRVRALMPVHLKEVLGLATTSNLRSAVVTDNQELRSLQLAFAAPVINTTTISVPQPNPTRNSDVQIPVQLSQEETVRLELSDVTGRVLFQNEQAFSGGAHLLNLPATIFSQPGVYVWRVQAGKTTASGKLIKL